jgi:hypothetical protein
MLLIASNARSEILPGGTGMPWRPFTGDSPEAVKPEEFFRPEEVLQSKPWSIG